MNLPMLEHFVPVIKLGKHQSVEVTWSILVDTETGECTEEMSHRQIS